MFLYLYSEVPLVLLTRLGRIGPVAALHPIFITDEEAAAAAAAAAKGRSLGSSEQHTFVTTHHCQRLFLLQTSPRGIKQFGYPPEKSCPFTSPSHIRSKQNNDFFGKSKV